MTKRTEAKARAATLRNLAAAGGPDTQRVGPGTGAPVDALIAARPDGWQMPSALRWSGEPGRDAVADSDRATRAAVIRQAEACDQYPACAECTRAAAEQHSGGYGRA